MKYKLTSIIVIICYIFSSPAALWAGTLTIRGAGGLLINKPVVSVKEAKYKKIVPQSVDFSCGAASLATILQYYYGEKITEREIVEYLLKNGDVEKIKTAGFSFLDLKRYATYLNYKADGFKLNDYQLLDKLKVPAIVLINYQGYQHFVVIKGVGGGKVFIADPLRGNAALKKQEFYHSWNGIIFVVLKADNAQGDSSAMVLEAAIADAPKPQVVRLVELGINNCNNTGLKNLIVFPGEF